MRRLPSPRDLLLFETPGGILVSAVDSCGGIGAEPHDALAVSPAVAGEFTARVALLEVLAVGAEPAFACVAIANGPGTAEMLLAGIRRVLGGEFPLIISTEKNMPTSMTAFGVTMTGLCASGRLLAGGARSGDALYCAGLPLVGPETLREGARLFDARHLRALLESGRVHALIPVGSHGVAAEARVLAEESGLAARLDDRTGIDIQKSAGPSSCAVFAAESGWHADIGLPVFRIGTLR